MSESEGTDNESCVEVTGKEHKDSESLDLLRNLATVEKALAATEEQIKRLVKKRNKLQDERTKIKQKLHKDTTQKHQDTDWNNKNHPWVKKLEPILRNVFKIKALRSLQLPTINAVMQNHCTILIMPTGGGKSLCYQLPALLLPGLTLVISPLVSLMEDQVMALQSLGVEADLIHSGRLPKTCTEVEKRILEDENPLKLLYCTPERLAKSKRFMAKLEKAYFSGKLSLFAVDEVHCCSQWGHDFRKDYKYLGILRKQFPKVPILGLTATAPSNVLTDVQQFLNIEGCVVFKAPLNRPNLKYEVKHKSSSHQVVMNQIADLINSQFSKESGIVYCFSIKDAEEVSSELKDRGIKARPYHAQMDPDDRKKVHLKWVKREIDVIVATIAFGMGIDKPDVRFVIHHSISKSMEGYYQESGRAGRDDKPARCIVFYRFADLFRQSSMVFADRTGLEKLYGMVAYCIDQTRCRREIIAQHFGEDWDVKQCNKMCDTCIASGVVKETDVTQLSKLIYDILDNAASREERMTAGKLLDTLQGKAHPKLRPANFKSVAFNRDTLEIILALLLVEGYLQEEFHFTPYTTIAYLNFGTKSSIVREENVEVIFSLPTLIGKSNSSIDLQLPKCIPTNTKTVSNNKTTKNKGSSCINIEKPSKKKKVEYQKIKPVADSDSDSCEVVFTEIDTSFGKF